MADKTTFTPGPWKLETVKTSVGVCHKIGPLGNSTKLKDACLYDDCYSAVPRDLQLLADAHLIVAAPELYAELKAAIQNLTMAMLVMDAEARAVCMECIKAHKTALAKAVPNA